MNPLYHVDLASVRRINKFDSQDFDSFSSLLIERQNFLKAYSSIDALNQVDSINNSLRQKMIRCCIKLHIHDLSTCHA